MSPTESKDLASKWIKAWNTGDLNTIMDYYADDVELHSPYVIERWKIKEGKISGKQKLQEHFAKAFEGSPSRNLELVTILEGVAGLVIIYKNKSGLLSADVVELNDAGKVRSVKSFYSES